MGELRRIPRIVFLFLFCFVVPRLGRAGTIRVPQDVNTISLGLTNAVAGDTILVSSGEYNEHILLKSDITLLGDGSLPIIKRGVEAIDIERATVDGFQIRQETQSSQGTIYESGVYCNRSTVTVKNCLITLCDYGIYVFDNAHIVVQDNVIENIQTGIYVIYGGEADIIGNTIQNTFTVDDNPYDFTYTTGIYIMHEGKVEVIENIIRSLQYGIRTYRAIVKLDKSLIYDTSTGINVGGESVYNINDCTICHTTNTCIVMNYASDVEITNSILWNILPATAYINYTSDLAITYSNLSEEYAGEGNIMQEPRFVDPDNLDFHLRSNSPCIDVGIIDEEDPDGTRKDMGAYHFDQLAYVPTPPDYFNARGGEDHVVLEWTDDYETFLAHFNIHRSTTGNFVPSAENLLTTTEPEPQMVVDSDLTEGVTYYYRVSSVYNLGNEGPFCDELSATPGVYPVIDVNPASVDFGSARLDAYNDAEVVVGNTGNDTLRVDALAITPSEVFQVLDGDAPFDVAPDEAHTISMRFLPPGWGDTEGTLTLYHNGFPSSTTINLIGRGMYEISILPNPFTPNGDGFNDYVSFEFLEAATSPSEVRIYDITGREVIRLTTPEGNSFKWWGVDREGRSLQPGVYIYVIIVEGQNKTNGTITLMR